MEELGEAGTADDAEAALDVTSAFADEDLTIWIEGCAELGRASDAGGLATEEASGGVLGLVLTDGEAGGSICSHVSKLLHNKKSSSESALRDFHYLY